MIYNLLNVTSISNNQDRVAGKQVGLSSLMGLWVSELLNSYQSTQVFRTGYHSLPLGGGEGVARIWILLCHYKIYLISPTALQYSDVPPPAPLSPTAHTNNHFIGSQFSIFPTLCSVSNDWSPPTPTENYVISQNPPTSPHPQANDRSLDKTPIALTKG